MTDTPHNEQSDNDAITAIEAVTVINGRTYRKLSELVKGEAELFREMVGDEAKLQQWLAGFKSRARDNGDGTITVTIYRDDTQPSQPQEALDNFELSELEDDEPEAVE